ncbi:MAG TPA: hypothetical protein VFQ61_34945, partial [Polyangiaceae bacterium]|nr:hypothetical protein [Polyangiaceae bacterium]
MFYSLGPGTRIALVVLVAAVLIGLAAWGLWRIGGQVRRYIWRGLAVVCAIGLLGFGWWSLSLPEPRGSYFILWHQVVRVGAVIS